MRNNPYFNALETLAKSGRLSAKIFSIRTTITRKTIPIEGTLISREVFLIEILPEAVVLDTGIELLWDVTFPQQDEYKIISRHLSLDKFYIDRETSSNVHGLSFAHYTEEHVHKLTGEKLVIHYFYNKIGKLNEHSIQIKRNGQAISLAQTSEFCPYLTANANHGRKILLELSKLTENVRSITRQQADKLSA